MIATGTSVLLYDGLCGFCDWIVRLLLRLDRHGVIRFASLQGAFASDVLSRHEDLAAVDSLVLVEVSDDGPEESVYVRSAAILRIARRLGGPWRLLAVLGWAPRPLLDGAYDLFARHRYRLFGRFDECPIPDTDVQSRFLA